MQSVGIFDVVRIKRDERIVVGCSDQSLCGSANLAYRAAELFFAEAAIKGGAEIRIEKNIPKAAGLAGGSADAAAVICGLNAICATGFSLEKLCSIGAKAGADVPFCIVGGTMLARGVGEKLSQVPALPDCYIVIAKKGEKTSTADLYSKFDKFGAVSRPDTALMLASLKSCSIADVGTCLCNVFEELVPDAAELKKAMLKNGALGSSLSGSGPSVFGIFDDYAKAHRCRNELDCETYICPPVRSGCVIIAE